MLRRYLIFICLLLSCLSILAQDSANNDDSPVKKKINDDEDDAPVKKKTVDDDNSPAKKKSDDNDDVPVKRKTVGNEDSLVKKKSEDDDDSPVIRPVNKKSDDNGDSSVKSSAKRRGKIDPILRKNIQQIRSSSANRNPYSASRSVTSLSTSLECSADIQKYCIKKGSVKSIPNLKVLQCIDDLHDAATLISKECQNRIYTFKYNITQDVRFDDEANRLCSKDIKLLDECNEHTDERGTGRLISCLHDRLNNITEPTCRNFINQMKLTIFTDWRLSEYFADACIEDIRKLECGRLDDNNKKLPHDQGSVISCLTKSQNQLSGGCRKQIYRLAEMQSDDYQLDRALYYACRDDRERLCNAVPAGNGRVYRCLYDQKFNSMMSSSCRKEVHRRQRLVVSNALVDVPLVRACNSEITEHQCVVHSPENDKQLSLINLLLCLEGIIKKGENIKEECRREMLIHRRMLMSDYALSPEIVLKCKSEMTQHCPTLYTKGASGTIKQRGGKVIHCLLKAAHTTRNFSSPCLSSIKLLVSAANPGGDIRADPLLETACRPVIDALCPQIKAGDSNVILCLLSNVKNTRMTEECEDRLMEVAYFMERDLSLTSRLLLSCRKDLTKLCQLTQDQPMNKSMSDVQTGMYLGCLFQKRQQLTDECRTDLKRLMQIRTQSIGLLPGIEENCITDLATCKNPEIKGEEMKCLQQKYEKLEDQCKAVVRNFTKVTMADPNLDFLLMKACEPMIQLFCSNAEVGRENDLLRCLIKHKQNPKMDYRCKAGVEHHQITSLKDKTFLSQQFQAKCNGEIAEHCPGKMTKATIIQCLADTLLRDVLKKQTKISEACRNELKFELLQRSESITFDPLLLQVCRNDIRRLCDSRTPGNAQILDCLKYNRNNVSAACFLRLRKREKLDVVLPSNDYSLMTKCSAVIQKYCLNEKKQNILLCLRRNINREVTRSACQKVLYHRLMVLNSDARFNKGLIDNCQNDINKYCPNEVLDDDVPDESDNDNDRTNNDDGRDHDMGGRIIGCLRTKYANTKIELESKCITELIDVIQTSKLDIKLDIKLYEKCKNILRTKCSGNDKEDCLKLLYQKKRIADIGCVEQVKRIIKEGQADIHVDSALAYACQADILKFCNDIPIGSGKQLQCLLRKSKSVTTQCRIVLLKRQELWSSVSDVANMGDLARHIVYSENNRYLYAVLLLILCILFLSGCFCRSCIRYRRLTKYK